MLTYPEIDPVAFSIGSLEFRWYGLMYLIAFVIGLGLAHFRVYKGYSAFCTPREINDGASYVILSVVLGGRLGYVLFYNPVFYFQHPLEIFNPWAGGMSMHGGFFAVIFVALYWVRKHGKSWWQATDFLAPLIPLGLMFGRIGNFISGDLWGRVTDPSLPWAMIFPKADDNLPRHPSQFYHASLEGLALFLILWFYTRRKRPDGAASGVFLVGYGVFRSLVEFFREPDHGIADQFYAASTGQGLPVLLFLLGVVMVWLAYRKRWPALAIPGALLTGYGVFRILVGFSQAQSGGIFSSSPLLTMGQCLSIPMIALGVFLLWVAYSKNTALTDRVRFLLNPDFRARGEQQDASP